MISITRKVKELYTIRLLCEEVTSPALDIEIKKDYAYFNGIGYSILLLQKDNLSDYLFKGQNFSSTAITNGTTKPYIWACIRGVYLGKNKVKDKPFFMVRGTKVEWLKEIPKELYS